MLQKLIEFIAPAECIVCGVQGSAMCQSCAHTELVGKVPSCVFCNRLTKDGRTCQACYRRTSLRGAHILWRYDGFAKDLITQFKYANDRSIADMFARQAVEAFDISDWDVITAVASDGASKRMRGYNQAELIAKAIARRAGATYSPVLLRTRHQRQVNLSRAQRLKAVEDNFVCIKPAVVAGKRVFIVDDVITTGATMNECAKVLRAAGAQRVWGLAIAKK